jgi:DNA invertase Pin-like site-specific DNA recombinase
VTNTSIWTGFSLLAYSALWFRNAKSTLAGKMVFTVLGAVAELERSLTLERVKAGLWNARAKRKTLGRPRKALDASQIARLRAQGCSWRAVAAEIGEGLRHCIVRLEGVPHFSKGISERGEGTS